MLYNLGIANETSVTFNDASVDNETNADVALCGAIEIVSIGTDEVTGKIDAFFSADSDLNGTFTVQLCP